MINRNYLRCDSCGHETMIRTALGHAEYQEFAFSCGGCGVEIRYGMDLDQKNAGWSYTKLINAKWIKSEKEPPKIQVRVFDTETLIPLALGDFFSPFLKTAHLPKDMERYHRDRAVRIKLCQEIWPVIRKLQVHYSKQNWNLYRKEWQNLDAEFGEVRPTALGAHFLRQLYRFGTDFRPFTDASTSLFRQRINLAEAISAQACAELLKYLNGIGWIDYLFNELFSIKDRWINIYGIVQPIYLSLYWDPAKNNLDDYAVSQKRFDELKPLFVDCYETLCRISVIAAVVEGIIFNGQAEIPNGKKTMPPDAYRGIDNGKKFELFGNLVPAPHFNTMADGKIRNGIGHHSAHYEVGGDLIRYRKENKKGVQDFSVPYTRFCEALVMLYIQFDAASIYINWIVARKLGLKGRVL